MSVSLLPKETLDRINTQPQKLADKILAQVADAANLQAKQALDLIEYQQVQADAPAQPEHPMQVVVLDPSEVPDMAFTKIVRASFGGKEFSDRQLKWNPLLHEMLKMIWEEMQFTDIKQLDDFCPGFNIVPSPKSTGKYNYVAGCDCYVNDMPADTICKMLVRSAKQFGWHLDIVVTTNSNDKCIKIWPGEHFRIIMPGTVAKMASNG